jgi:hypothetical protein
MPVKILLPELKQGLSAQAHPYPFQIAFQTLEFLQGAIFYASLIDVAAGEFFKLPDGLIRIEKIFIEKLYSKKTYDEAWGYLEKYRAVFEKTAFQSVIISLNSHWDWYIRKLGEFISFARFKASDLAFSNADKKRIARISYVPILEQLKIVELASGVKIELRPEDLVELKEMTLVRNLGLHNRWEVDERYIWHTQRKGISVGDVRVIDIDELYLWHRLLIMLVNELARQVAIAFVKTPTFP